VSVPSRRPAAPVARRLAELADRLPEPALRDLAHRLAEAAERNLGADAADPAWASRFPAPAAPAARPRPAVGPWLSDAIYGVNDGLGAVFGIVAGVAGYTHGGRTVLISGLAGLIASALSMGGGAYLAARSEHDAYQAGLGQMRRRVAGDPAAAAAELADHLRGRGYGADAADTVAAGIAARGEEALALALLREERGLEAAHLPRPLVAALTASASTAVGAFVPIVPFFFGEGFGTMVWAAAISLAAHFAVGAAKAAVLGLSSRLWSGLEMTLVGALEGVLAFGAGLWAVHLLPR
jgi:VIT1/CCC1 family predicted Fe2+/Mn2+ transporter